MTHTLLRGAGTALVTPFLPSGEIDEAALRKFVEWQIEQGIHFVVPVGSTGEAATLNADEQRRVVEITVDVVQGRVPVVAGAGSNDTAKAVETSKMMKAAGATHLLHSSPMYNKPPQRGIIEHFKAIADATDLPVVVYNVPGRTGSNIEAATTLKLAQHPNITAVKEASGNIPQIAEIIRNRPENFTVLSGDDPLILSVMAEGGDGVISVTSNVTPKLVAQLCDAMNAGELEKAREIHHRLAAWSAAAFCESNPIPAKAALAHMGMIQNVLRLPLVPLLDQNLPLVVDSLVMAGVIQG